jgi:hypothetical protein
MLLVPASLCLVALFAVPVAAQDEALPARLDADIDSPELASQMAALAKAAMACLADGSADGAAEGDRDGHLNALFRLQLAAGEFQQAAESIEELRELHRGDDPAGGTTLHLQYQVFAEARLRQEARELAFPSALAEAFADLVGALDDRSAQQAQWSFGGNLAAWREDLRKALEPHRDRTTIALADAVDLARRYQVHATYAELLPLVDGLFAADDARRYVVDDDRLIETPDGAQIAALVVRARSAEAPQPALLGFTIYANDAWAYADAKKVAANGYAGVVAYSRGKGRSPGPAIPYEHDGRDAAAVIDWIAEQPWSDGRVGMYGGSYNGFTAWAAAKHHPKALKAIAASATAAPGIDVPMQRGVFLNFIYPWPFYTTNGKALDDAVYDDRARWDGLNRTWYRSGKAYAALPEIDGTPNPLFLRWLSHPDYDAYWQQMIPYREQFADIDIPVFATTGYFDGAQVGALYYFEEHLRYRPNADHTLVVGPYEHLTMQWGVARTVRGYVVDPVAVVDLQALRLRWFDHVLKGGPKPELLRDRVNYQVMGADAWKHASTVAAMADGVLRLYASDERADGNYRLSSEAPSAVGSVVQQVDFRDRGDADGNPPYLVVRRELALRNALVFVGAPLSEAIEVSGLLSGELAFETNKRDFDLSVTLYELTAGGDYVELIEHMGRASYAAERSERRLLRPGERQTLRFRSEHLTSRIVAAGSRPVLALAINKRPDLQINYGSGKDVADETIADSGEPLRITWFSDSFVDVPVAR